MILEVNGPHHYISLDGLVMNGNNYYKMLVLNSMNYDLRVVDYQ